MVECQKHWVQSKAVTLGGRTDPEGSHFAREAQNELRFSRLARIRSAVNIFTVGAKMYDRSWTNFTKASEIGNLLFWNFFLLRL